jgi:lipopolysaccharide biosynthesis glycosyltransferase
LTTATPYYIATAADEKYYVPMYTMLLSLFENNKDLLFNIAVLQKDFTVQKKQEIELLAKGYAHTITWLNIDDTSVDNYYTSVYITSASYYRIFLSELLPENVHTILYLDADIIVNSSIKELLRTDLQNTPLAAIKEAQPHNPERLGIFPPYDYFNAGVLLMNLIEWRKHNYADTLKRNIISAPEKYIIHDQDLLNEFFHDKVKYLHPNWNHQTALYGPGKAYLENRYMVSVEELFNGPVVIHFTGWLKPWHYISTHPYKSLFVKYCHQTPFSNFVEKGTPVLWLKRLGNRVKHKLRKIF